MSRYIESEWLKGRVHNVTLANGALHGCIDKLDIHEAPSIDIVRCGECQYWHKNRKAGDGMNVFDICYDFQADDFCSYGERRE